MVTLVTGLDTRPYRFAILSSLIGDLVSFSGLQPSSHFASLPWSSTSHPRIITLFKSLCRWVVRACLGTVRVSSYHAVSNSSISTLSSSKWLGLWLQNTNITSRREGKDDHN